MANITTDGKECIERELVIINVNSDYNDLDLQFDIVETSQWIRENSFIRACLQFPDELLRYSSRIYEEIKKRVDVDLYILGDTSYASCCVDSVASMHVQGNAIVHYGRTCFSKTNIPVFTVLPKKNLDAEATIDILKQNVSHNKAVKLCLFYDAEFHHCKEALSQCWFKTYPKSYIAYVELEDSKHKFLGRVCRNITGDVCPVETLQDCVCVYIGSRGQTLFNYSISIPAKQWFLLDPDVKKLENIEETAWSKRRRFLVEKCKDANVVGILVCQLSGDMTKDIISRMKKLCRVNGKKSYIVSVGKPNVAKLANFPEIDIYVMVACPENELYSSRDFYRPLVYPYELEVALNSNREQFINNHVTDYNDLLKGGRHYVDIDCRSETDVSLITGKIRETKIERDLHSDGMEIAEKQNWALENIGQNLQDRSWKGLEQKLGETEVKLAEQGRAGIPLQYKNELK